MTEENHLEILLVATSHQIFILESNAARLEASISESMAFEFSVLNYGEIRIQTEMLNHRKKELKDFRDAYLYFRGKSGRDDSLSSKASDLENIYNYIYNAVVVTFEGLIGAIQSGALDSLSKVQLRDILDTLEL